MSEDGESPGGMGPEAEGAVEVNGSSSEG
jgi:hypothetical protein